MEKIVEQGLLYDFYGELLTEHQKKIYEDLVYHDLSLAEIAEENGITRQGVHDLIKRCDHILMEYEDKLQLIQKFSVIKQRASEIVALSEEPNLPQDEKCRQIQLLSQKLIEEL